MTNGPFPSSSPPAYPPTPPAAGPQRGGRVVGVALLVGALAGAVTGAGGAAVLQDHHALTVAQAAVPDKNPALDTQPVAAPATDGSTEAAAAAALPSVVKIYASGAQQSGSGSGIVLTDNGEILTNNHVVELAADGGKL
ncbi:MAG: trypsin, partial [Nocardioidaceae bacterium]|nr:trypsin [Nocardioidaceae bacterium]